MATVFSHSQLFADDVSTQRIAQVLSAAAVQEAAGDFVAAARILDDALLATTDPSRRITLTFERDRLRRIERDYPFTEDQLRARLRQGVRDVTDDEFRDWLESGRFDSRIINGERRYMTSSVRNLFYRHPELEPRRTPPRDTTALQRRHLELAREIRAAARAEGKPYVLPKTFLVQFRATVEADAVPSGETIRAWLPIPREFPFQRGFKLIDAQPTPLSVEEGSAPLRCVYSEGSTRAAEPTIFELKFRYQHDSISFEIDSERVTAFDGQDPELARYVVEAPHIEFTPQLRQLSNEIVGDETNPARVARKLYDWIGHNIRYSLSIEYSTIRNLSEYCRERRYGDCGQEGMLFIALCRLNGIPARWQSGWNTFPGSHDIHDWSEIYLAPYGWVPVDPYMSLYARQYTPALTESERGELADFYFGGLDPYRMACNCDHGQPLAPLKDSPRSDTIDFQRGEFEASGKNIYYDQFRYHFESREIDAAAAVQAGDGR